MQKRKSISTVSSWISLIDQQDEEVLYEETMKKDTDYKEYPITEIYADMLPPDYLAILSLCSSIIGICWCVSIVLHLLNRTNSLLGYPLLFYLVLLLV